MFFSFVKIKPVSNAVSSSPPYIAKGMPFFKTEYIVIFHYVMSFRQGRQCTTYVVSGDVKNQNG